MKMGKGTGPWGSWRVAARALVTLMAIQYLLPTGNGATYRAPGDWLVRQGRVHLSDSSCCNLLDGRNGECRRTGLAPAVFGGEKSLTGEN